MTKYEMAVTAPSSEFAILTDIGKGHFNLSNQESSRGLLQLQVSSEMVVVKHYAVSQRAIVNVCSE